MSNTVQITRWFAACAAGFSLAAVLITDLCVRSPAHDVTDPTPVAGHEEHQ